MLKERLFSTSENYPGKMDKYKDNNSKRSSQNRPSKPSYLKMRAEGDLAELIFIHFSQYSETNKASHFYLNCGLREVNFLIAIH